jgi:ribose transport system permease protein
MKQNFINQQAIVGGLMVIMFLIFAFNSPTFIHQDNLVTLMQNVSILGILSLGMGMIVIGRGIDLSMISALVVPPGLLMALVQGGYSIGAALLVALALAIAFGALNGWLIAYAEVSALFTTLASGLFLAGFGQAYLFQLETVQWPNALDRFSVLGRGTLLHLPLSIWIFGAVAVLVGAYLKYFRYGRFVYAMGDNPASAHASGIPVRIIIVVQYVCSALIAAFAGAVLAASLGGMPTRIYNSTLIYDVILVVVLGGIGLAGGRGGISNILVGTLFIGIMLNGLTILDVSYSVQNLIRGFVLLAAIMIDSFLNPRNEETAQQGDI